MTEALAVASPSPSLGPVLGLHVPDGFLGPGVLVAAAALSLIALAMALRTTAADLGGRQIPLAGLASAFVFAAQMVNFPVAAGTSGHLIGAALAAVLLGPRLGAVAVTVVVVVQALLFADGGVTALGVNVLNLAVVPSFGGWAMFRLFRRLLPSDSRGVIGAAGLAAGVSVVLSAAAFSIEWLFGATAPVPFDTVFAAMVGVHVLIGIGEGIISGLVVASVLASRPDLVAGAADLEPGPRTGPIRVGRRPFAVAALLVTIVVATVISQFAADEPDGLERVAEDQGFATQAVDHPLAEALFADYATDGLGNERLSLAVAGAAGIVVSLAVTVGLVSGLRRSGWETDRP